MPEGDTVWRTARSLDRALTGQKLTGTDFRVPDLAVINLSGEQVLGIIARGKHLLTTIGGHTLHTHLKMEGSWHLYPPGMRWRRPAHEARVVLATQQWQAVGFALGIVELVPSSAAESVVGHLGPDLLGPGWDPDEAVSRLSADPTRAIGEALLDQRNLAGIGNVYRAELCFIAGVHPGAPVATVTDLPRLVTRAKLMLHANKERAVRSTTGDTRPGRSLWVYRRDRRPCLRCATLIRTAELGGRQAYWCPACQPLAGT